MSHNMKFWHCDYCHKGLTARDLHDITDHKIRCWHCFDTQGAALDNFISQAKEALQLETLTDPQLELLCLVAKKRDGFPTAFQKHLLPESQQAFAVLLKRELIRKNGENYVATADGYLLLENGL